MKQLNVRKTEFLTPLPDAMTVCATVDDSGMEHEITELMIRRACEQMDANQLWPYASDALSLNVSLRVRPSNGAQIIPFPSRSEMN